MGALAAIVNSQRSTPLGGANPALYGLPAADFRDETSPSPAGPGYDTATGLGSPLANLLVPALSPVQAGSLTFATGAQTLTAGVVSGPISVQISSAAAADVAVTFKSSSSAGSFAPSASGPWSSTLAVTIAAGTQTSPNVYYEDTKAGSPTLTASASGYGSASQSETVAAGPLLTLSDSPSSATVAIGHAGYTATGADAYGNSVSVNPSWSVSPRSAVLPQPRQSVTFTSPTGSGTVTATAGALTATSSLAVVTTDRPRRVDHLRNDQFLRDSRDDGGAHERQWKPGIGTSVSITINRNGSPTRRDRDDGIERKDHLHHLLHVVEVLLDNVTKLAASLQLGRCHEANQICK